MPVKCAEEMAERMVGSGAEVSGVREQEAKEVGICFSSVREGIFRLFIVMGFVLNMAVVVVLIVVCERGGYYLDMHLYLQIEAEICS